MELVGEAPYKILQMGSFTYKFKKRKRKTAKSGTALQQILMAHMAVLHATGIYEILCM